MVDLATLVTGGAAARPDSLTGLNDQFMRNLQTMIAAAPPDIQQALRINSGYRSPQTQERLWANALQKYGSPEAARKWVAPPGRSQHNHGKAADLKYMSPAAKQWAHSNAGNYGLAFPLSNEDWHIELAGARGGHQHAPAAPAAAAPTSIAQMYQPQAATAAPMAAAAPVAPIGDPLTGTPATPGNPLGQIALMFMRQQQERQQQRQEEQAAEQIRRAALFDTTALFG